MINDKEFAWAFIGKDTFCVLSSIRMDGGIGDRYVNARVALGGRRGCGAETWLEEVELLVNRRKNLPRIFPSPGGMGQDLCYMWPSIQEITLYEQGIKPYFLMGSRQGDFHYWLLRALIYSSMDQVWSCWALFDFWSGR